MHPVIVVEGDVSTHESGVAATGGPTVPCPSVCVPVSLPLLAPELGTVTMASCEQLTGISLSRKKMTGWAGSELHCTIEAKAPGANPVPETFTTCPPATPEQIGMAVLVLLQAVAPAAASLRARVGVAPDSARHRGDQHHAAGEDGHEAHRRQQSRGSPDALHVPPHIGPLGAGPCWSRPRCGQSISRYCGNSLLLNYLLRPCGYRVAFPLAGSMLADVMVPAKCVFSRSPRKLPDTLVPWSAPKQTSRTAVLS